MANFRHFFIILALKVYNPIHISLLQTAEREILPKLKKDLKTMTNVQNTEKQAFSAKLMQLRSTLAHKVASVLIGRPVSISTTPASTIASSMILWYFEGNTRKFIMVREKQDENRARFVSCLDSGKYESPSVALMNTCRIALGEAFIKTVDKRLFDVDRVMSAPMFKYEDKFTGKIRPIQALVWMMQITPEQAELCLTHKKGAEVVAIPEFAIVGGDVTPSHRVIYQASLRHIHAQSNRADADLFEALEDLLKDNAPSTRILH